MVIILISQDTSSAVIDIANTDDLQSEPGNVERLVLLCLGKVEIDEIDCSKKFFFKVFPTRVNLTCSWTQINVFVFSVLFEKSNSY